eukprot:TRINITY_DN1672_c0_g1_i1.p1 TRINITY_DN1672_c0_g1~~TRINITY_DN1672_c0_g1_i1.p1  ORF type:complete len:261 (+),score=78.54 TRINITY_DN1672_c0_g1_i1:128-910(+)
MATMMNTEPIFDDESDSSDEYSDEIVQPQAGKKNSFQVEADAFPAFGGPTQQVASSLNFGAAWASTAAPASMPEPVVRRRPAAAPASSSEAAPQSTASPQVGSIPWRESDWSHKMASVPQWGGKPSSKFGHVEHEDPYAAVSAVPGKPRAARAAPVAKKSSAVAATPEEPKPKKAPRPAAPKQDGDGFTEVVSRKNPRADGKAKGEAVSKSVKSIETSSSFDALIVNEDNTPKKVKEQPKQQQKNSKKQPKQQKLSLIHI